MISIALTTYNGEKYINEQIKSLLEQTVPFDELIVCDDRSTDNTISILKSYDDNRIKIYENPINLGYIRNFYKAVSLTTGDLIFLCDQDDIWTKNKLEIMSQFILSKNATMICSNFSLIDAFNKKILDKNEFQLNPFIKKIKDEPFKRLTTLLLAFGNVAQGCTYCFTSKVRDIYLKLNNKEVIHDYQIALISSVIGNVYFLNQELIEYRIHETNSVGFSKRNRNIIINKTVSKEPFMYRFFRELNEIYKVNNLFFYKILYYLRIPFLRAVLLRKLLGE